MKICRFCLDEKGPLSKIHETDNKDGKHTVPLPLQIMACVAIEVRKSTIHRSQLQNITFLLF